MSTRWGPVQRQPQGSSGGGHMRSGDRKVLLKVVILGDGGVGKSCLMNRFISNNFDEHSFHTIGVEFLNKNIEINRDKYTLQIWDTAGQERFKSLRTPFYRGSDICLLTYAIDDRTSFSNLSVWMEEFRRYADVQISNERYPFIVVGNKSDITPREVTPEQLADWCNQYRISSYIETSAKTASNVIQAFTMAVERWLALERLAEHDLQALANSDTVDLSRHRTNQTSSTRTGCCGGSSSSSATSPNSESS